MKPTQHNAKSRFTPKTGPFATLASSLRAKGTAALSAPRARFALAALLAVLAACLAPSSALASTAHEFKSSFGPDGTNATHFETPGPVAVDQESHDLYVADLTLGTVGKFDQNGAPVEFTAGPGANTNDIPGFSFSAGEALNQIAVAPTSHDFYVASLAGGSVKAFEPDGEISEFTAGPGKGTNEITGFGLLCGVAVDAHGDIYAADLGAAVVDVYKPSGEKVTSFPAPEVCNLAVDSTGAVYVAPYPFSGLPVTRSTPSEFPVTPTTTYGEAVTVDLNRAFGVAVDPSNDDLYVDEHTRIAQFQKDGTQVGSFAATVPGALTASEGIAVDGVNENVYASDTEGEKQVGIFSPPPPNPPTVGQSSFSNVTAASADLQAQVNPEFFDTHYRFEYLTESEYLANAQTFTGAKSTPEADLGSTGEARSARAHVGGLAPDTTYLFRVAAENNNNLGSPVFSAEPGELTTSPTFPPGLPDGRAYELVSPPQKVGEVVPPEPEGRLDGASCHQCLPGFNSQMMSMQSTADGDAVAYVGQPFSAGLAPGMNEYLAARGSGGWGTQSLGSPLFTEGSGQGFQALSPDLSRGVLAQIEPVLSPEAPTSAEGKGYYNLYLRAPDGSLRPLITAAPPNREAGPLQGGDQFQAIYASANAGAGPAAPAFGHIVFAANDALTAATANAPAAVDGGVVEDAFGFPANLNLYESFEGQLRLVNVLPGNSTAPDAVIGSGRLLAEEPSGEGPDVDHAISADGSRIFWSEESSGQVYVRSDGKETQKIEDPGKFLTATPSGSKVLLSDGCLYDLATKTCKDLTLDQLSVSQGGFKGILGGAEDLSRVYFVDTKVLTGVEKNANKEQAVEEAGKFNLYAWHEGATRFIGTLLERDNRFGDYGDWKAARPSRVAQVSADGSYLTFMSEAPLSGYDNAVSGGGECRLNGGPLCQEVFVYSAASAKLTCASCNPTGQRPLGASNLSLINPKFAFPPLPQLGNLSAEGGGRLFFESRDTLSPRDTNGHIQDIYEWEPSGVGSCHRAAGCVFLISSGHSNTDSEFLTSTPSGNDAFIVTREQLLTQDKDEQLDLYDARVGGGIGATETPPCGGEACRGPLTGAPPSQPPQSSVFTGPGNLASSLTPKPNVKPPSPTRAQKLAKALKACAKKPKKKRRACRAQARKRYGPIKAKTTKSKSHKGATSHAY